MTLGLGVVNGPDSGGGGSSGGPRGATVTVASSTALNAHEYDFVCIGVDDDDVISAAIHTLPNDGAEGGGKCLLSEGFFYTGDNGVTCDLHNVTLEGQGQSTVIVTDHAPTNPRLGVVVFGSRVDSSDITGTSWVGTALKITAPNRFEVGENITLTGWAGASPALDTGGGTVKVTAVTGTWPNQTDFTVTVASVSGGVSTVGSAYGAVNQPRVRELTVSGVADVGGIIPSFQNVGCGLFVSASQQPYIENVQYNCVENHGVLITGNGVQGYFRNIQGRGSGGYTTDAGSTCVQTNSDGIYCTNFTGSGNHVFDACILAGTIHNSAYGHTTRMGFTIDCSGVDLVNCHPYEMFLHGLYTTPGTNDVSVVGGQYETNGADVMSYGVPSPTANGVGIYADTGGSHLSVDGIVTYLNGNAVAYLDGQTDTSFTNCRFTRGAQSGRTTGAFASVWIHNSTVTRFSNCFFDQGILESGTTDETYIDGTCNYSFNSSYDTAAGHRFGLDLTIVGSGVHPYNSQSMQYRASLTVPGVPETGVMSAVRDRGGMGATGLTWASGTPDLAIGVPVPMLAGDMSGGMAWYVGTSAFSGVTHAWGMLTGPPNASGVCTVLAYTNDLGTANSNSGNFGAGGRHEWSWIEPTEDYFGDSSKAYKLLNIAGLGPLYFWLYFDNSGGGSYGSVVTAGAAVAFALGGSSAIANGFQPAALAWNAGANASQPTIGSTITAETSSNLPTQSLFIESCFPPHGSCGF